MKELIRKLRSALSREVLLYVLFGVLTTAINYVVFIGLNALFGKDTPIWAGTITILSLHWDIVIKFWLISNIAAFIAAVTFAFITNRNIVFEAGGKTGDRKKDRREAFRQATLFWLARLVSLAMEYGILYVLMDVLGITDLVSKVVSNVFVVVVNYFFSKFVVFSSRRAGKAKTAGD
jgi:putative flippase GtrA